jgi:hypothetical protein
MSDDLGMGDAAEAIVKFLRSEIRTRSDRMAILAAALSIEIADHAQSRGHAERGARLMGEAVSDLALARFDGLQRGEPRL